VVIADDLVASLAAGGTPLAAAVDAALRRHLEAERRAAEAEMRGEKIPFWLRREGGGSGEMEDALRDRIAQRRAGEEDR
jgi:orotate phosphoribosyltransferase